MIILFTFTSTKPFVHFKPSVLNNNKAYLVTYYYLTFSDAEDIENT